MNRFWNAITDAAGVPRASASGEVPKWARLIALSVCGVELSSDADLAYRVACVRAFREGGPDALAQLDAAYQLGGYEAARDFISAFMENAQGKLAGGTSASEEKET